MFAIGKLDITDLTGAKAEAQEILKKLKGDLTYSISEIPPWYTSILLGFQVRLPKD